MYFNRQHLLATVGSQIHICKWFHIWTAFD